MRIGYDMSPMTAQRSGVGRYCHYLLEAMVRLAPEVSWRGFSSGIRRIEDSAFPMVRRRHVPLPTRALYTAWSRFRRPRVDRLLGGLDVFHATNYVLPPVDSARRVLTLYDMAFAVRPDLCSPKVIGPFTRATARFASQADAILTCSEASKADIVSQLGVPPEHVTVAPGAVAPGFGECAPEQARARVRERYGLEDPYILFAGTLEPRKNLRALVTAYARLVPGIPHRLVLLGAPGWRFEALLQTIDETGMTDRVVRPGYVPDDDLACFYAAAGLFAFPSLYEGFGLPVLEAMACGCPVVTARNSSLPEVAGDAAFFVDAESTESIAEGLWRVLREDDLRDALRARGYEQAARFTWDEAARRTLAVYEEVCA